LLQITPYPWGTPLPPPVRTVLDGTYVKFDPSTEPRWPCRRCPDYKPEGGTWLLNFDSGVFRIHLADTGWSSFGSMTVAGDRVVLFNDPNCIDAVGEYRWKLEAGALALALIADECAIGLRGKNLTKQPWLACQGDNQPTGCP
jgi:hypothetical protein